MKKLGTILTILAIFALVGCGTPFATEQEATEAVGYALAGFSEIGPITFAEPKGTSTAISGSAKVDGTTSGTAEVTVLGELAGKTSSAGLPETLKIELIATIKFSNFGFTSEDVDGNDVVVVLNGSFSFSVETFTDITNPLEASGKTTIKTGRPLKLTVGTEETVLSFKSVTEMALGKIETSTTINGKKYANLKIELDFADFMPAN